MTDPRRFQAIQAAERDELREVIHEAFERLMPEVVGVETDALSERVVDAVLASLPPAEPQEGERRWTLHARRRPSNYVDPEWECYGPPPVTAGAVDNSLRGENVEVVEVSRIASVQPSPDPVRAAAERVDASGKLLVPTSTPQHLLDALAELRAALASAGEPGPGTGSDRFTEQGQKVFRTQDGTWVAREGQSLRAATSLEIELWQTLAYVEDRLHDARAEREPGPNVTEEMVRRAHDAYWDHEPPFTAAGSKDAMRAALEAAAKALEGPGEGQPG